MTLDQAVSYVEHSVAADRLAQAYVVAAPPRGSGGEFARRLLSLLLCKAPNPPCGDCAQCKAVEKHTHPDLHWLEPQKKSRIVSVDQMRDFLKEIYRTSFEGGWKAGILVAADCLGREAANAFLKTLEEPPGQTVFLLLTDSPQRLLPTILSRCQRLSIEEAGDVQAGGPDRELLLAVLAESGEGRILDGFGRADRLVQHLKTVKQSIEKEEKQAVKQEDVEVEDATLDARIGARYREWRHGILQALLNWYRDVLILVCGADACHVSYPEALERLQASAARTTYRQAIDQVKTIEAIVAQLNRNLPESLVFEHAFLKLK